MTTRQAVFDPYKSTSIWKAPRAVDSDCTFSPANLSPVTGKIIGSSPIGLAMDKTQPQINIYNQGPTGTAQTACANDGGGPISTVPMDPNFIVPAPSGKNLGAAWVHQDGHTYDSGAQLARCGGAAYSDGLGAYATVGKLRKGDDLNGDGLVGDTGASHLPTNGGCLRIGELVPGGVIAHRLQLILPSKDMYTNITESNCYRWPSTTADGYFWTPKNGHVYGGGNPSQTPPNPKLTMGAIFCLKSSFNVAALQSAPGKILAQCLIDYGAILANTISGGHIFTTEVSGHGVGSYRPNDSPPTGDVTQEFITVWPTSVHGGSFDQTQNSTTPWANDCAAMFAALQILDSVDNNSPSHSYTRVLAGYTASGVGSAGLGNLTGGAPLVPFSPDIGQSGTGGGGAIARTGAAQQAPNPIVATSATVTLTKTLVVGEGILLFIDSDDVASGRSVSSVSDGTANAYSHYAALDADQGRLHSEVWYCSDIAVGGGSQTITVTMTTATGAATISAVEFSGQDPTSMIERYAVATGTGANPASGNTASATTLAGELAFGHVMIHSTTAPTAPVFGSAITSSTAETAAASTITPFGITSCVVDGSQTAAAVQSFGMTAAANPWIAHVVTCAPASAVGPKPGVPTNLTAVGGNAATAVAFSLPATVGDGITSTVISYYTWSGSAWVAAGTSTITGNGTSKSVPGTNGTQYMWSAHCVNDAGAGPETAMPGPTSTPAATPAAPSPPIAPVIDSVGITDAVCDWGPIPPNPGTQPITSYSLRITIVGGGVAATFPVNDTGGPGGGPSLSFDATGLETNIPYTAAVAATNIVGTSAYGPESAIFQPANPGAPPTAVVTTYPPAAHPAISARYAALLEGTGS